MFTFEIIDKNDKVTKWHTYGMNYMDGDSCICNAMLPSRALLPEMNKSLEQLVKEGVKRVVIIYNRKDEKMLNYDEIITALSGVKIIKDKNIKRPETAKKPLKIKKIPIKKH